MSDASYRPRRFWPLCLKCRGDVWPQETPAPRMQRWRCMTCHHEFPFVRIAEAPIIRIAVIGSNDSMTRNMVELLRSKSFPVIVLDSVPQIESSGRMLSKRISDAMMRLTLTKAAEPPKKSYRSTYGPQRRGRK